MFRILPVNEFAARKKLLVAQSDVQRQEFLLHVAEAEHSFDQFKKRFAIFGISSVALSVGASIAGLIFGRHKPTAQPASGGGGGGIISKILSGISTFNQVKSIFARFRSSQTDEAQKP